MTAPLVSRSPYDGREIERIPPASREEVDAGLDAACAAAGRWATTSVRARAAALEEIAVALRDATDELAALVVAETGKRVGEATAEAEWTAATALWYAEHPPTDELVAEARVRYAPIGVVAAITPWNAPLVTPAWKIFPALMAGNAVVWKPSELATASASALAAIIGESALPRGLLTMLPGRSDVGAALVADPRVDGVHFTGSSAAGRAIAARAGQRLARCALELGGSNPAVVLDDADLDAAARDIAASMLAINGQKCTATRRVVAAQPVYDELLMRLVALIESAAPGDPADPATAVGPLITSEAVDVAHSAVARAERAGARLHAQAPKGEGVAAFPPTILGTAPRRHPFGREELFAPVLVVERVQSDAEAVRSANATPYGLAAAVYTQTPERARTVAERIEAGVVGVNRPSDQVGLEPPFLGWKQSGNGVAEGGTYAYDGLCQRQVLYGLTTGR
jgi:acyl-CoA reductase-like NAD-dependent aldehyde dehydrogenase